MYFDKSWIPDDLRNFSEHTKFCNMQIRCHYLLNAPKLIEIMYFDKSSSC